MRLDNGILEPSPRLTERQMEVLRFIWRFFRQAEFYPTHREIANGIGASSTNMSPWLNALVKKGVLSKKEDMAVRNIRITARGLDALRRSGVIPADEPL